MFLADRPELAAGIFAYRPAVPDDEQTRSYIEDTTREAREYAQSIAMEYAHHEIARLLTDLTASSSTALGLIETLHDSATSLVCDELQERPPLPHRLVAAGMGGHVHIRDRRGRHTCRTHRCAPTPPVPELDHGSGTGRRRHFRRSTQPAPGPSHPRRRPRAAGPDRQGPARWATTPARPWAGCRRSRPGTSR